MSNTEGHYNLMSRDFPISFILLFEGTDAPLSVGAPLLSPRCGHDKSVAQGECVCVCV